MELQIGEYRLISDTTQFKLYHMSKAGEKAKIPGEDVENLVGYYSTIESALKALPTRMLIRSDAQSLAEVMLELKRYRGLIMDYLHGA